jgi:hypothetical protein
MTPTTDSINTSVMEDVKEYILTYRDGVSPLPVFNFVRIPSSVQKREVVAKCQKYCRSKSFRFVSVRDKYLEIEEPESDERIERSGFVPDNGNSSSNNSSRSNYPSNF